ncbi:O-methyltransferase [Paenisporosarcina quisquiliarum]|uniref:tRNA 5-hydroxyuridine methyltransferase n=1 Tax=Paenisporosarcina quisquiliarum TaxID=365346 RepID=A0A9X3LE18_9BACL|nr:O-methyltransferase [Paenisporosarcina quisquiliarum]MCZ8536112.1 O-methyltransferase [Paenisporosarcina quisquiliarum]
METSQSYITSHIKQRPTFLSNMEQFAKEQHIPIMEIVAIESLLQFLRLQQPKSVLEIGSAIGYSAIRMALALPEAVMTTIEKDEGRFQLASSYVTKAELTERIQLLQGDALEIDTNKFKLDQYDALFIDAAKGQYQRFFDKYSPLVPSGGVIYCDNMLMHGFTEIDIKEVPRRKRTMVRNLQQFTSWLMNHEEYETTFLPIGDGITISIKR